MQSHVLVPEMHDDDTKTLGCIVQFQLALDTNSSCLPIGLLTPFYLGESGTSVAEGSLLLQNCTTGREIMGHNDARASLPTSLKVVESILGLHKGSII
jgi:hypothetical protein